MNLFREAADRGFPHPDPSGERIEEGVTYHRFVRNQARPSEPGLLLAYYWYLGAMRLLTHRELTQKNRPDGTLSLTGEEANAKAKEQELVMAGWDRSAAYENSDGTLTIIMIRSRKEQAAA